MRATLCIMITLVVHAGAFYVASVHTSACVKARFTVPKLAIADVEAAASAVKKVAAKFGKAQADRANAWLDTMVKHDGETPTESLLNEQLVLFEECLLDDEGGKCKELDAALTAFESALTEQPTAGETRAKANLRKFAQDRAGARVRAAASKFGTAQKAFATDWTREAVAAGATSSVLMEQTLKLFDQCEVTADGKADPKCVALFEALDNLQIALTGEVSTPAADAVENA